jgi:hypothetical protein
MTDTQTFSTQGGSPFVAGQHAAFAAHWLAFGNEDDSNAVPLRGKGESSSPTQRAKARLSGVARC